MECESLPKEYSPVKRKSLEMDLILLLHLQAHDIG